MAKSAKTRPASPEEARVRARTSTAYLEVAGLVLEEREPAMPGVAAGIAVLAGIAAADAICGVRLREIHRGDDHRAAAVLLSRATPDGAKLAATFKRLIDMKDEAHYGLRLVPTAKARSATRWAALLVARAIEEVER